MALSFSIMQTNFRVCLSNIFSQSEKFSASFLYGAGNTPLQLVSLCVCAQSHLLVIVSDRGSGGRSGAQQLASHLYSPTHTFSSGTMIFSPFSSAE